MWPVRSVGTPRALFPNMNRLRSAWAGSLLGILGLATACGGNAEGAADPAAGNGAVAGSEPGAKGGDSGQPEGGNPAPTTNQSGADQGGAALGGNANMMEPTPSDCAVTEACQAKCAPQPSACLFHADGSAPVVLEDTGGLTTFDAKVTAIARDTWEPRASYTDGCLGLPTADRIHVSLQDTAGKAWELSLSPEQVDEHHYAVGEKLRLEYFLSKPMAFAKDERLVIRAADKVDLFFVAAHNRFPESPLDGVAETDDSGLTFAPAMATCDGTTTAGADCTGTRSTLAVSAGAISVTEPCGQDVGDFNVTAAFTPGSCAGVPAGFCDAVSVFFASGLRRR